MSLLYFGLSLSIVGLVGGQTSQASQPFWGEEKLGRDEEALLEKEERFDQQLQPSLNATTGSLEKEPWPLRECIAILGDHYTTFVADISGSPCQGQYRIHAQNSPQLPLYVTACIIWHNRSYDADIL